MTGMIEGKRARKGKETKEKVVENFVVVPLISTCSRCPVHELFAWTGYLLHVEINGTTTKF